MIYRRIYNHVLSLDRILIISANAVIKLVNLHGCNYETTLNVLKTWEDRGKIAALKFIFPLKRILF